LLLATNKHILNSSICLFIKAIKSIAPPPLFLLELLPRVASDLLTSGLLASGAAASLGFNETGFSGALVVFLSPVFWNQAGGALTSIGLFSATTLPTKLFNKNTSCGFSGVFLGFSVLSHFIHLLFL